MLAYLFWHWPENPATYEADLIAFHRALRSARVAACLGTATYRVTGLPWLVQQPVYEDWYLLEDFASLDALNRAAVSPALRAAHDRPALAAAGGTGGLYAVSSGSPRLDARVVSWLAKPRGMSYSAFFASLPAMSCLLQRQLSLGPGLEFCAMDELPGALHAERERLC